MPNTRSAAKRVRVSARRRLRNRAVRSQVRTAIKQFLQAVQGEPASAPELLRKAVSTIDKAAAKGVIHKNAAARYKARLSARLNGKGAAATQAPKDRPAPAEAAGGDDQAESA